jgi:hypothetical protein
VTSPIFQIVDLGDGSGNALSRGYPRTVVRLENSNRPIAKGGVAQLNGKSFGIEHRAADGDAVFYPRSESRSIGLSAVGAEIETILELMRLKDEGRAVWLNPNVGATTIWSVPCFRSLKAMVGPDLAYSRSDNYFAWCSERREIQLYPVDVVPSLFGGPYGRYTRPGNLAFLNKADTPTPTAGGHGWSINTGTPVLAFESEVQSPLVSRRLASLDDLGGMTKIEFATAGGSSQAVEHPATGLTSAANIGAVVYIQTPRQLSVSLLKADASTSDSVIVSASPYVQQIRLAGAQSAGGTTAKLLVAGVGLSTTKYACFAGPVWIGNTINSVNSTPIMPDFTDGLNEPPAETTNQAIGAEINMHPLTFSCIARRASHASCLLELGASSSVAHLLVFVEDTANGQVRAHYDTTPFTSSYSNLDSLISEGDYFHLVVVIDDDDQRIYINGTEVVTDTNALTDGLMTDKKALSRSNSCHEGGGGMMLARLDQHAWTDDEVTEHYLTYFQPIGRNYIAPNFGKTFRITDLDFEPYEVDVATARVKLDLRLKQIKEWAEFSPTALQLLVSETL